MALFAGSNEFVLRVTTDKINPSKVVFITLLGFIL